MDTDKGPLPHSENRTAQRNHRKKLQGHMEDLERQDESSLVASPQTSLESRDYDRKEGSDHEEGGYHETFEEMSTIMTSAPTKLISSQCRECLDLFQKLRGLLEELDEDASSEYQKHESLKVLHEAFLQFQAWSANIGALHSEHLQSSLDYRLREAKNIRERIMKVLRHLAKSLDDASSMISEQRPNRSDSSSESDLDSGESETSLSITHTLERIEKTELQGLLSTSQGSISNLMKLSMIIRNSPARDDYPKAAARYQFDPRYDIGHVIEKHGKSKFSKAWLLERLGRAITIRRQYLTYRKEHHGKLSRDWDEVVRQTKGKDNVTVAKSAALTKATTFYEERHEERPEYSKEVSFSPAGSQTSYDPTEFSGPNSSKLAVPPHPIMAFDDVVFEYGRPFLCPYCYIEQQVKDRNAWKRHVFRDLKPYVCTFEECDLKMFSSRHEWFKHEMKIHRREWSCPYCQDMPYRSKPSFKRHLNSSHFISDTSQIEALLLKCSEPQDRVSADACYLCNDWEKRLAGSDLDPAAGSKLSEELYLGYGTTRRFEKHLGQHMEQLALFVLSSFQTEDGCTDSSGQENEIQEEGSDNPNDTEESVDDALKRFLSPTHAMATEDIAKLPEPEQELNVEKEIADRGAERAYRAALDVAENKVITDDEAIEHDAEKIREKLREPEGSDRTTAEEKATADAKAIQDTTIKAQEDAKAAAEGKAIEEAVAKAQAGAKAELDKVKAEIESKIVPEEGSKKPVKFTDAVGRKFSFPFHLCQTWQGMEELIKQAFLDVEIIGPHVQEGHYDLIGPDGEIILPQVWEAVVEPGWSVTMHMWPMPEPKPPPTGPIPGPPLGLNDPPNHPPNPFLPGYGSGEPGPNIIMIDNRQRRRRARTASIKTKPT